MRWCYVKCSLGPTWDGVNSRLFLLNSLRCLFFFHCMKNSWPADCSLVKGCSSPFGHWPSKKVYAAKVLLFYVWLSRGTFFLFFFFFWNSFWWMKMPRRRRQIFKFQLSKKGTSLALLWQGLFWNESLFSSPPSCQEETMMPMRFLCSFISNLSSSPWHYSLARAFLSFCIGGWYLNRNLPEHLKIRLGTNNSEFFVSFGPV